MEDLQSLLEKINRDGVEKAESEAQKILSAARDQADALVKAARDEAEKTKKESAKSAEESAARAEETIRQAARDVLLSVKDGVRIVLENLLVKSVDKSLGNEEATCDIVSGAIRELSGSGEISCGGKLAKALASRLAALGTFTVVTDDTLGSGFTVKLDGGRVEHTFTGEVIAAELAKRLRPDLAKLIAG